MELFWFRVQKDFSLAQTLAQTGFFTLWHGPSSVAPGQAGFFSPWHCPASVVAPGRAGLLYGTSYYSPVAPLAQTGMTRTTHLPKAVAPGRAGRALRSK
jgi:hypothetical protein